MSTKFHAWLCLFRIVNLPTIPGDVFVGAASATVFMACHNYSLVTILLATFASCSLYLFGLADNDCVGARTDVNRPIPNGELALAHVQIAKLICLSLAIFCGAVALLPSAWWILMSATIFAIFLYNRLKWCALMGLCRALNIILGFAAAGGFTSSEYDVILFVSAGLVPFFSFVYFSIVTKLAKTEHDSLSRKMLISHLIGGIIYFQIFTLVILYTFQSTLIIRTQLILSAVLLLILRVIKMRLPKVSAT